LRKVGFSFAALTMQPGALWQWRGTCEDGKRQMWCVERRPSRGRPTGIYTCAAVFVSPSPIPPHAIFGPTLPSPQLCNIALNLTHHPRFCIFLFVATLQRIQHGGRGVAVSGLVDTSLATQKPLGQYIKTLQSCSHATQKALIAHSTVLTPHKIRLAQYNSKPVWTLGKPQLSAQVALRHDNVIVL
jgi:hypothetical protein